MKNPAASMAALLYAVDVSVSWRGCGRGIEVYFEMIVASLQSRRASMFDGGISSSVMAEQ